MILASAIPDISLGAQKFKMSHMTLTTPISMVIRHPDDGTWYSQPVFKI